MPPVEAPRRFSVGAAVAALVLGGGRLSCSPELWCSAALRRPRRPAALVPPAVCAVAAECLSRRGRCPGWCAAPFPARAAAAALVVGVGGRGLHLGRRLLRRSQRSDPRRCGESPPPDSGCAGLPCGTASR